MVDFTNLPILAFCAFSLVVVAVMMFLAPKLGLEIRRVPALDAVDEAVGMCAERGTPLLFSFGSLALSPYINAGLEVLKYISRKAGETGVARALSLHSSGISKKISFLSFLILLLGKV